MFYHIRFSYLGQAMYALLTCKTEWMLISCWNSPRAFCCWFGSIWAGSSLRPSARRCSAGKEKSRALFAWGPIWDGFMKYRDLFETTKCAGAPGGGGSWVEKNELFLKIEKKWRVIFYFLHQNLKKETFQDLNKREREREANADGVAGGETRKPEWRPSWYLPSGEAPIGVFLQLSPNGRWK